MKFQAFHVNPGEKLKKKYVNNDLSHFMSVFPTKHLSPKNSILIYGTYKVNLNHVYKYMCIIVYLLLQQLVTPKLWSKNTTL